MDSNAPELPFLSNIGLMLTYRCTVACPHCIVQAGPHRRESMDVDEALAWIQQAAHYRGGHVKGLALTGGEPFYDRDTLAKISEYGRKLGLLVSVVTNAFWASTRDAAIEVLANLPAVQLISISTDVYHQRAIPFDRVKNAVAAAAELGRVYSIAVCTDSEEDPGYRRILADLEAIGEADRVRVSLTYPAGRARAAAQRFQYRTAAEPTVSACSMASSPVVFPDGKVLACIGPLLTLPAVHPMFLGNLRQEDVATLLDRAELNPVLHALRIWGPHALVSLLRKNGYGALLPSEYISDCVCDACYKLLSDPTLVAALMSIGEDEELRHTIAYGRLYYLNETTMLDRYGIEKACAAGH